MGLLESVLHVAPVMPVVVIEDARHAVSLARALVAGGIPAIEITLRTRAALDAVRAIANEVEGAIVGVGTVRKPQDLVDAQQAGARFAVSPGSTPGLIAAAKDSSLPWLPGAATASEAMTLAEHGFVFQKFFPAEAAGGAAALRSLHGPLPEIRFCATGGIGTHNAPELPGHSERGLRRRLVADALAAGGDRRMGRDRSPGARRYAAAGLTS